MKNKRGLIGKIFVIIGIIIFIIIVAVAVTAYQIYGFVSLVQEEMPAIQMDIQGLGAGDCSRVPGLEVRIANIKNEAESTCKNPLIAYGTRQIEELPFNCDNLDSAYNDFTGSLDLIKRGCDNL